MAERSLFNCIVEDIEYYRPVRLLTPTKYRIFWLARLSLLFGPAIDLNYIKIKSHGENSNISNKVDIGNKMDKKVLWLDGYSLPIQTIS